MKLLLSVTFVLVLANLTLAVSGCSEPTALERMQELAKQGDPEAQYKVGLTYARGQGVPEDILEAMKWFRQAAEQGNLDAHRMLGMLCTSGDGLTQDIVEGIKWYRKGAEKEDARCQTQLGNIYYGGRGMPEDLEEAYGWYSVAAAGGAEHSQDMLDSLKRELSSEQLARGQQRATELFEQCRKR